MTHYVMGRPTGPLPWQWQYRYLTLPDGVAVYIPPGWQRIR